MQPDLQALMRQVAKDAQTILLRADAIDDAVNKHMLTHSSPFRKGVPLIHLVEQVEQLKTIAETLHQTVQEISNDSATPAPSSFLLDSDQLNLHPDLSRAKDTTGPM